jgi:hypothetical protein
MARSDREQIGGRANDFVLAQAELDGRLAADPAALTKRCWPAAVPRLVDLGNPPRPLTSRNNNWFQASRSSDTDIRSPFRPQFTPGTETSQTPPDLVSTSGRGTRSAEGGAPDLEGPYHRTEPPGPPTRPKRPSSLTAAVVSAGREAGRRTRRGSSATRPRSSPHKRRNGHGYSRVAAKSLAPFEDHGQGRRQPCPGIARRRC